MENNWVKVYEDDDRHMVEIVKAKLKDAGILPVSIDEKDQMIPSIGEMEVYVRGEDAERAKALLRQEGHE